ncbi:hypothetical protein ACKWTF_016414 [Chironomus riparius]
MDSNDKSQPHTKFKDEYAATYPTSSNYIEIKKSCKVMRFTTECGFNKILSFISKINDFPNLFIFVIEIENIGLYKENIQTLKNILLDIERPIIIQVIAKIDNQKLFYYKKENDKQFYEVKVDQNGDKNFSTFESYLNCFATENVEKYEDKFNEILLNTENSTLILRFLRTLDLSDRLFMDLIYNCAESGSKADFLAALDAPFEGERRFFIPDADYYLCETINDNETTISVLYTAIQNSNGDVVNYLITHCTHLIELLPFEHRIDISTAAFNKEKFDVLCDLLEYSDFPFPRNIANHPVTHERLTQICKERNQFHEAIRNKIEANVNYFTDTYFNNKMAYDTNNKTALFKAITSRNFEVYCRLKSLGFKSEYSEKCEEYESKLTGREKELLSKQERIQTKINADCSISDSKKYISLLSARSLIHNRKVNKSEEIKYRKQIVKWLEELSKIEVCKAFLDAAAQCEDLKIIFDFESLSVDNVDLKGKGAVGTTYAAAKYIFIAAKLKDKDREQNIKGVLIHEICHYVMRLVYENNEEPYYKNDKISKKKFDQIVSMYDKFRSPDTNDILDDKCGGIISTVYTLYPQINYTAELVVRPAQIFAKYDDNDKHTNVLQAEYKPLFDYVTENVLPELKKFDLRHRSSVRKLNKIVGHLDAIKEEAFVFTESKVSISNNLNFESYVMTSNVPKLLLSDLFNSFKLEYLPDTKTVFIRPQDCKNQSIFDAYSQIVSNSNEIRVIIDCSKGMGPKLEDLLPKFNLIIIVSNEHHSREVMKLYSKKFNKSIDPKVINYRFCDLTPENQLYLLQTEVQFQNEKLNLHNLLSNQITQVDECFLEIVDDKLLKLLVDEFEIQINVKFECEKYFQALYRSRNLIEHNNDNLGSKQKFTQEEFLKAVQDDKSIIISDIGGNGKSWTLKNITIKLRKQKPSKWVSYIHLRMFENIFDSKKTNSNFLQFMSVNVLSCNTYERAIFKRLYKTGNCCILLDGYDELNLTSREFVKELMMSFKNYGGNQIWVATRDIFKDELQTVLHTKVVYKPAEFTVDDAIEFIKTTWMLSDIEKELKIVQEFEVLKILRTKDSQMYQSYAENLVSKIFNSKFLKTGLPNICKIAADIFKDQDDKSMVYSLNVDMIYDEYVKNKYHDWSNGTRRQSNSSTDSETFLAINQYQAVKNICPMLTPICDLVYKNVKFYDEDVIACGLTSRRNDNVIFEHESFNEYFLLSFLAKVIKNFKDIFIKLGFEDIIKNLMIQFFNSRKFDIFRSVADNVLNDIHEVDEVKQFFLKFFNIPNQNVDTVDFLFKMVEEFYAAPQKSQNIVMLTQVVNNWFGEKKFVKEGMEFFNKFPEISEGFSSIANKFIYKAGRKLLPPDSDANTDFYALSTLLNVDSRTFATTFDDFLDRCSYNEQTRILKECDKNKKNILHLCVEKQKQIKLKFLWRKIEGHFENFEDFKAIVTKESLPFRYNVFHAAVVYNKNIDFHEIFWTLSIESFKDQSELLNILLKKDINGNNVVHLMLLENKSDVIEYLLIFLRENLQNELFKDILASKNVNGNNLIQVAIIQKYGLSYLEILWNIFNDTFDSEFMDILTQTNVERNNVFQLAARFSSNPEIIKFMIEKLDSSDLIKLLLKNKDRFNRNILQSAARQNESLNCHEYLWEIIETHFDTQDLIKLINNRDNDNDNVLHCAVSNNINAIAEYTLKKIELILEEDELVKYLKLRGHRRKNLKKLSLENTKDHEVVEWVENIIGSIYSKHPQGSPTTILTISRDKQLNLNNEKLQEIFNHPDVTDRQIVVISIIGVPKKGKSFILNYCLRYLYAHYPSINHPDKFDSNHSTNWIEDDDEPLVGFTWNCANNCDESSLILWNDVFLPRINNVSGKIAILVMDTQNCIEHGSSMFNFTALFSSKLILNFSCMPNENICESLKDDVEEVMRKLGDEQAERKIFQNCTFLFRDWEHLNNYKIKNSKNMLDKIFTTENDEKRDMKRLKLLIESLYENLSYHMLSYPGKILCPLVNIQL